MVFCAPQADQKPESPLRNLLFSYEPELHTATAPSMPECLQDISEWPEKTRSI